MDFGPHVRKNTQNIFEETSRLCRTTLEASRRYFAELAIKKGLDATRICCVAAGSFGRGEALEASDFDLIPIVDDPELHRVLSSDAENRALRSGLREALGGRDVSTGRSVTGTVQLAELIDPAKIGGAGDDRVALTRRIVVLTEAAQAGGEMALSDVRRRVLSAYTTRTGGPHPLAFCNDLVRYYRTLCMDYKAKSGSAERSWAESNVKLRHSRKFWYFASALATAAIAEQHRPESSEFVEALLEVLSLPPSARLFRAVGTRGCASAGRALDQYAWYLDFMRAKERRDELNQVQHQDRYSPSSSYASLQWSSKVMHSELMNVLNQVEQGTRDRVIEWFLL